MIRKSPKVRPVLYLKTKVGRGPNRGGMFCYGYLAIRTISASRLSQRLAVDRRWICQELSNGRADGDAGEAAVAAGRVQVDDGGSDCVGKANGGIRVHNVILSGNDYKHLGANAFGRL